MKREPSIHITYTKFKAICQELGISVDTETFFMLAKKAAVNSRNIVVSNNRQQKKVNKILLASHGDASLVADIIYAVRIKLNHRGVRKILETNSREWSNCKKLAEICNTFCQDFDLQTREGFIKYIEIGITRMKGNNRNLVTRLISMQEVITEQFESQLELSKLSPSQLEKVATIKDYFYKSIADATGIYEMDSSADRLIHFLKLKELCDEYHWDYKQFIDAQFESLAWCNGIPSIRDLSDSKAIERYNKYLYKMRGRTTIDEDEESLWSKIKES